MFCSRAPAECSLNCSSAILDFVTKANSPPLMSIDEAGFDSTNMIPLRRKLPSGSRFFFLRGKRSWPGTLVIAGIASRGSCIGALHEGSEDGSKFHILLISVHFLPKLSLL